MKRSKHKSKSSKGHVDPTPSNVEKEVDDLRCNDGDEDLNQTSSALNGSSQIIGRRRRSSSSSSSVKSGKQEGDTLPVVPSNFDLNEVDDDGNQSSAAPAKDTTSPGMSSRETFERLKGLKGLEDLKDWEELEEMYGLETLQYFEQLAGPEGLDFELLKHLKGFATPDEMARIAEFAQALDKVNSRIGPRKFL